MNPCSLVKAMLLFLNIEFTRVTFICKTIQVSRVQLNKTSSAHCIVHPPPPEKSLSIPVSPHPHLCSLLPTARSLSFWLSPHCCLYLCVKAHTLPWLVWLSGLSAGLQTKGSPGRFPVRAHAWVTGQVPSRRRMRGSHTMMFLSLSFSLSSPLSKNK